MKPSERRDKILRIRAASLAWQQADQEIDAVTGERQRMRTFLHEMRHGDLEIRSTADVPRAMGAAWRKATAEMPDQSARNTAAFEAAWDRKRAASEVIYSPEVVAGMAKLRLRRPSGVDEALIFLEANPLCFHSGYDKQRLLRYLRHTPLTGEQEEHLRTALLVTVREGAGVEFRDHCRTARIVDTVPFRRDLQGVRDESAATDGARKRAGWMLDALVRTNGAEPPSPRLTRAGPRSRSS